MKQTLTIALAIFGITFNISPVHASNYTCKDIVAVSKLVVGGTTWTSSQTSYAHGVRDEAKQVIAELLLTTKQKAKEGDRDAKYYLHLLSEKGLGSRLSLKELTLKAIQRVHLGEARVMSIVSDWPSHYRFSMCVSYGLGAYVAS